MKKKLITFFVGVFALAFLAACGGGGAATPPAAADTPAAPAAQAPAAADTADADDTVEGATITFWHWDINMQEAYELLFAEFYNRTGVTVEQSVVPWADYWPNLATALPAGGGPDIMWMNHPNSVTYMPTGLLLDLTDFNIDMSGIPSALYAPYIFEGRLYGVAVFFDTIALFYNKDIFDEAGVPYPPHRGWTWDELREAAIALTYRSGGEVVRYGISFGTHVQGGTNNFIWQNGGEFQNADRTAFTFDNPESLEAIQFWHRLIWEDGVALNPIEPGWTNFFLNGLTAMEIHGMWRVAPNYEYLGDRLGIAHLPMRVQEANTFHSVAHVANANTQNLEAVRLFMDFSASQDAGDLFAPVFLPAHRDSQELWFDNFPNLPTLTVFTEAAEFARPLPIAAQNAGAVWTLVGEELSRIYQLPEVTMEDLAEISANITALIHE